jgi:hypothetical protein
MSDTQSENPAVHEGTLIPPGSGDVAHLRAEIERTREHLGATVEQLAAKVDVKSRARVKAAELTRQAKSATAQARKQPVPLSAAAAGALAVLLLTVWFLRVKQGRR